MMSFVSMVGEAWLTLLGLLAGLAVLVVLLQNHRRWLARLPATAALLVLVFGSALAAYFEPDANPLMHVYRAFQLFAGESEWARQKVHSTSESSSWLAYGTYGLLLLALLATASLIVSLFHNIHGTVLLLLSRVFAPRQRIVLCGLGEVGMQFVDAYRKHIESETNLRFGPISRYLRHRRLVIVEQDPLNPNIETCLDYGYAVMVRNVFDPAVQRQAGVHRASYVVHALPDDRRNIELAIGIRATCESMADSSRHESQDDVPRLLVHVDDLKLARRAEHSSRLGSERCTETRFFNLYETSARMVFDRHSPDWYAAVADADRVHIAIYGFNSMAEALLEQAVRLCHFDRSPCARVTLLDQAFSNPSELQAFRHRYPHLDNLEPDIEIRGLPLREDDTLQAGELAVVAEMGGALLPPTQHFVCFEDDAIATRFALDLRDLLRDQEPVSTGDRIQAWNAPVFIRLKRHRGLARMFDVASQDPQDPTSHMEAPDGLYAFGMLEDSLAIPELLDQRRDTLARIFHQDGYRSVRDSQKAPTNVWRKESDVEWEHLNLFLKHSNRAQADHLRVKLRSVRCVDSPPSVPAGASEEELVERITRSAHESRISSDAFPKKGDPETISESHPGSANSPDGNAKEEPGSWHRFLSQPADGGKSHWERLAMTEHARWNAFHWLAGWRYGPKRVDPAHVHDNLVPWDQLDDETKAYDRIGIGQLPFLLREAGLSRGATLPDTVCRRFLIGITAGVRGAAAATAERHSEGDQNRAYLSQLKSMMQQIQSRAEEVAEGLPVRYMVVSAATDGPERRVVQDLVNKLDADLIMTLPLPFELLYMDFRGSGKGGGPERWASIKEYAQMVAADSTRRYLEMPMRFGNLEKLGADRDSKNSEAWRQYELADAWLLQHCDALVCVDRPGKMMDLTPVRDLCCEPGALIRDRFDEKARWCGTWLGEQSLPIEIFDVKLS